MTTEERLRQAAVIGNNLAEMLRRYQEEGVITVEEAQYAREARTNWNLLMAEAQREDSIEALAGDEENGP